MKYNFIDLFSGVGGLSYGFYQEDCKIVFALENDEFVTYEQLKKCLIFLDGIKNS